MPFNLALSAFVYCRAAHSVALHLGYDVKDDPRELQFAAEGIVVFIATDSKVR